MKHYSKKFKSNKLDEQQIILLKEIGLELNPYGDEWDSQLEN